MDVPASSSSDSESLSEDEDSDDEVVSDSGSFVGGAWILGVDCVDSSEDESSSEEEEPEDTARLLRFLFLLRAGFGAGGPIAGELQLYEELHQK